MIALCTAAGLLGMLYISPLMYQDVFKARVAYRTDDISRGAWPHGCVSAHAVDGEEARTSPDHSNRAAWRGWVSCGSVGILPHATGAGHRGRAVQEARGA